MLVNCMGINYNYMLGDCNPANCLFIDCMVDCMVVVDCSIVNIVNYTLVEHIHCIHNYHSPPSYYLFHLYNTQEDTYYPFDFYPL